MNFKKPSFKGLFKNQDSKYFLKNAFNITLVPVISFGITFYSLWIFLEMNHSFFRSNGFASGEEFKAALFDSLLLDVQDFFLYFMGFVAVMYMVGLMISYFVMRPFKQLEKYFNEVEDIASEEIYFDKISKKKLIVQSIEALINFLKRPEDKKETLAQEGWFDHNRPKPDYVFYMQYFMIMAVVVIVTSISVFIFTQELHASIVGNAMAILKNNQSISIFFQEQQGVLNLIYSTSILLNAALYAYLAKGVIGQINGVSFAFYRDIKAIINGDYKKRIFPRFTDPGKGAASAVNEYLDLYFETFDLDEELENHESLEDSGQPTVASTPVLAPAVPKMPEVPDLPDNVAELEPKPQVDAPPVFIDKQEAVGGGAVYHIITPKGYRVDNLGEDQLVRVLKELELKDM
jgi:hypothetical protein